MARTAAGWLILAFSATPFQSQAFLIGKFLFTKDPTPTAAMWQLVPPSVMAKVSPMESFTYWTLESSIPHSAER